MFRPPPGVQEVGVVVLDVTIAVDDPGGVLHLQQKPDHQPEPREHRPVQRLHRLGPEARGEQGPRQVFRISHYIPNHEVLDVSDRNSRN